ncbi:MAG: hypothetical protein R3B70_40285 [Polyangiaceae bacterium]
MSRLRLIPALALAVSLLAAPAPAQASGKTTVTWTKIDVPDKDNAAALTKSLKAILTKAAKKANFGKAKKVSFSVKLVELTSEQKGDVHRVTCTIVGRIPGGPSAKSRISFGGSPAEKAKLEKQVLTMVAKAVVTRLAEIVRSRAAKEEAAKEEAARDADD